MKPFANDMEYEIHWLRRASTEIETIYRFYKHFASDIVAKRRISKIIHSVDYLKKCPISEERMKISSILENIDIWLS